jgi:hypothetical protein
MQFDRGRRFVMPAAVATALVVLVPSAAAASSGHAPALATGTTAAGAPVTLTVSITGLGTVVSSPAGISCGSTCSAQFPDGTYVALDPEPANGYAYPEPFTVAPPFTCVHSNIHDPSQCSIYLDGSLGTAASVQVTFVPHSLPPPCTVPEVRGKTLAKAEALLTRTHCGVGTVKYAFSLKAQKGRVISQNPKAHWQLANGSVDLVVGKGRRKSHHGTT